MAEQTSRTERTVMASPRTSAPQTSEGEPAGVKPEKQAALPQWPFPWPTSDAWRVWYRPPQLALRESVSPPAKPASERRLQRAGVQDGGDPPASIDRLLHASFGRFTLGLSPAALWLAYADWAVHLWASPGKRQQLAEKAVRKAVRFATYLSQLVSEPDCRALHRAFASRPAVPKRGLAAMSIQPDLPGISSEPAMVAQRHDRHRRRVAPS